MSLLLEFYNNLPWLGTYLDDLDLEDNLVIDRSLYNIVDGEEGDYGIIKYYLEDGVTLIATFTNYGGDDYDTEFSEAGKMFYLAKLKEVINNWLDQSMKKE